MALKSWLESANDPDCGFPIQNLPYGVFRTTDRDHIGVAIGDRILDLHSCAAQGLFRGLSEAVVSACSADVLNPLMALGKTAWVELRSVFTALLSAGVADGQTKERVERSLIPMGGAVMRLPAAIGDCWNPTWKPRRPTAVHECYTASAQQKEAFGVGVVFQFLLEDNR